jgi:hypothetical protein
MLTQLRDTLLPKLMSGEVRVKNKTENKSLLTDKNSIFISLIFILLTVSSLQSIYLFFKNLPPPC